MGILKKLAVSAAMCAISLPAVAANATDIVTPVNKPPSGYFYRLNPGESFVSQDGRFKLTYQSDGNFVLYQGTTVLWYTNTQCGVDVNCYEPFYTVWQDDGNLVVYNGFIDRPALPQPVWASNTGNKGNTLVVQNDGNVVIYNSSNKAIWSSHTCCH